MVKVKKDQSSSVLVLNRYIGAVEAIDQNSVVSRARMHQRNVW